MKIPYFSSKTPNERRAIIGLLSYVGAILGIGLLVFGGLPEWAVQLLGMLLHVYTGIWIFTGILILAVAAVFGWIATDDDKAFKDMDAFTQMGKTRLFAVASQASIIVLVYMGGFYVNGALMLLSALAMALGQFMTRNTLKSIMRRKLSNSEGLNV